MGKLTIEGKASKKYSYETPNAGEFRFGFTSDPQIKENGETNNGDGILLTEKIRPDGQLCWTR